MKWPPRSSPENGPIYLHTIFWDNLLKVTSQEGHFTEYSPDVPPKNGPIYMHTKFLKQKNKYHLGRGDSWNDPPEVCHPKWTNIAAYYILRQSRKVTSWGYFTKYSPEMVPKSGLIYMHTKFWNPFELVSREVISWNLLTSPPKNGSIYPFSKFCNIPQKWL